MNGEAGRGIIPRPAFFVWVGFYYVRQLQLQLRIRACPSAALRAALRAA